MLIESQGKLEKSQGKVREFCVKNLADTLIFVSMTMFDKIIHVNKASKEVKHLKATLKHVNAPVVIDLIAQWLPKIMHHKIEYNPLIQR